MSHRGYVQTYTDSITLEEKCFNVLKMIIKNVLVVEFAILTICNFL